MHNSGQQFWTNKHVIVTGGAGFLGSSIVRKLHERGAHTVIVPRSQLCDLRHDESLTTLFDTVLETAQPADVLVIHAAPALAASVRTCASRPPSSMTTC